MIQVFILNMRDTFLLTKDIRRSRNSKFGRTRLSNGIITVTNSNKPINLIH